jgi:hypothetical protein
MLAPVMIQHFVTQLFAQKMVSFGLSTTTQMYRAEASECPVPRYGWPNALSCYSNPEQLEQVVTSG